MKLLKLGAIAIPLASGLSAGTYALTSKNQSNQDLMPPPISNLSSITDLSSLSVKGEFKKEAGNPKVSELFKKLDDYTFKLFSPCSTGTGWILDYLIPKKGKYPTVWYIATNAHVVREWFFDSTNTYEQKFPVKQKKNQRHWDYYNWLSSKYPLYSAESCHFARNYNTFDINLSKQSYGRTHRSDWGAVMTNKIKQPKLFWAAIDLFDEDSNAGIAKNHLKDFAVIEIEFTDEQQARMVTRNFADKYKVNSPRALNIFGSPIDTKNIEENDGSFYSLGYPTKFNDRFGYTKALDKFTQQGEKLSKDPKNKFRVPKNSHLRGHVSAKFFNADPMNWNKKKYYRFGHFYLLEGFPLGKGASGSMVVDEEGNLIGVKSKGEIGNDAKYSMITPIRSKEMKIEGNFTTPEYDLILGAPKQKSSYKQQIEKFNKTTWLSSRGWKNNS